LDDLPPIDDGSREPHPDDMERRIAALESDMHEIKADLKRLTSDIGDLKRLIVDVAEIKGRLSQMPTTVQLTGLAFGIFAALLAPIGMR